MINKIPINKDKATIIQKISRDSFIEKKDINTIIVNPNNKLRKCCPLKDTGAPDKIPCNFEKAIQNVMQTAT